MFDETKEVMQFDNKSTTKFQFPYQDSLDVVSSISACRRARISATLALDTKLRLSHGWPYKIIAKSIILVTKHVIFYIKGRYFDDFFESH